MLLPARASAATRGLYRWYLWPGKGSRAENGPLLWSRATASVRTGTRRRRNRACVRGCRAVRLSLAVNAVVVALAAATAIALLVFALR